MAIIANILRTLMWLMVIGYLLALAAFAVGTFGLFGADRDPLSGILLIPIGLPWIMLAADLPETVRFWAAILSPLLNIGILMFLVNLLVRHK